MNTLTISTVLALSAIALTGPAPTFAATQAEVSGRSLTILETGFKQLSTADRIQVQRELANIGLYESTLDGLWGRNTANALQQALVLMEQNIGGQIDVHSQVTAQAFLNRFLNGSAGVFIWGEGEECDGCEENDSVAIARTDTPTASPEQALKQAIFKTCMRNAELINEHFSTDPFASNAFSTRLSTPELWSKIGLPVSKLHLRHVNNEWQPVSRSTLEAACADQEEWAETFGSELQYLGEQQRYGDLAYFDSETQQLSTDVAVYNRHSVAVYPLTPREDERLNGIPNVLDLMAVSFHLTEQTACRTPQGTAADAPKSNTECGDIQDVRIFGQPVDLTERSQCRVEFHITTNTYNVAEQKWESDNLTAFNKAGGYATFVQPFGMTTLMVWSHNNHEDWQQQGTWFLRSLREGDIYTDILGSATDAFEQSIDWQTAQQELSKAALTIESHPANGRDTSPVVTHPACQSAFFETRNQIASKR